MVFLSPGIAYWLPTLLHWCDNNTVFIADISRVYANSIRRQARNKFESYTHTTCL